MAREKGYSIYGLTDKSKGYNGRSLASKKKAEKKLAELKDQCYPIRHLTFEDRLAISYTPISAKVGGLFAVALREAAHEFGFRPQNITGLGPADIAYAKVTQLWQFYPEPSIDQINSLKQAIETLLQSKIRENFPN